MIVNGRRASQLERRTKETDITLSLDLDGGPIEVDTSVKFLDHMLDAFAKHSGCGLKVSARGDGLDHHHVVEDVGIVLGKAIAEALGEKRGLSRFGSMMIPLDDALIAASVDLWGRWDLNFNVEFTVEDLGDLKTELIGEFFRAVVDNGKCTAESTTICARRPSRVSRAPSQWRKRKPGPVRYPRRRACSNPSPCADE